jgi:peptidyl-prolyl cis-trans isomerase C
MKNSRDARRAQCGALFILLLLILAGTAAAEDIPVARVNGVAIPARELEEAIDQLIPRAVFHGNISAETRGEFREKALDDVIVRELQHQDARARGLKPDKQVVRQEMEKVRDRYPSKDEYRKALARGGYTEETLKARFERDALVKAVIAVVVTGPARVNDAELKEYYDRNVSAFMKPEAVRLRIISARDEKKVKEALALIKAGEEFGSIAARMSEDSYRIKGGDIGFIHRGRIYPPLEEAAFRMKTGEVSDLILAEGSWFIIRVEEKQPARQVSFEDARAKLKQDLEKKRTTDLTEKWVAALREKAVIEIVPQKATGQNRAQ